MASETRRLASDIIRCTVLSATLSGEATACRSVVSWLGDKPGPRYLPEAWNGHLAEAPILFISSNPAAGPEGQMVVAGSGITSESSDEEVFQSTDCAFDKDQIPGIIDGIRMVGSRENLAPRPTHYWIWARRMARDLLGRAPAPGQDYALTEVVHCGSGDERGVDEALETCSGRYLKRVILLSPAKLLVLVGDKAVFAFQNQLAIRLTGRLWGPDEFLGKRRWVLSLPHPGSHKRWGLANYIQADTLEALRRDLL